MITRILAGVIIGILCFNIVIAQSTDLSSVDEFLKVTAVLKEGKEISAKQWQDFDSSACYKEYANRKDPFVINTIKSTINIVFGHYNAAEKDSILGITPEQMKENPKMMFKKSLLTNYLDVKKHYDSIQWFRKNYDFNALAGKAKQRLSDFLGVPTDSAVKLKPVYFFFINLDGAAKDEAIYVDFNLIYKEAETQRINFLAHEFFHNYREHFENHDFNYKCDLNHCIDNIQNEGIADQIDKSEGYQKSFTVLGETAETVKIWTDLYNQAPTDLERFQNLIIKYSKNELTENEMVDELLEIVKFNGHPIGFYMSTQIIKAGYGQEMLKTFYNPYQFFILYNKAAKKLHLFQISDEFMDYLNQITKEYYH